MNLHFQDLLPQEFSDDSRVWIYQSNRPFTLDETLQIDELLEDFAQQWTSHGSKVKGFAKLFFGQFIILIADETSTGVSGCSTDGSVRIIKNIEQDYNVDLFNRQMLAFIIKEKVQLLPLAQVEAFISANDISSDTLYFNNIVQTKNELLNKWIIPLGHSWLKKKVSVLHS